ncbi:MAG: murein hydrolase activator EnvC family protein [Dethiobacteria bacterium]|nr:peptidoglycan DD-metalloendopeptidase family protein [Bacillota bacterium]
MNTGKKLWIPALFLTLIILFSLALPVYAMITEEIEAKQQELDEIEKKRRDEKSALEQRLNREMALQEELNQLETRVNELRLEQERLAGEIAEVEEEIRLVELELADAEEQLRYQEDLLKLRLRAIQQHGLVKYVEVLFDSSSFSDFLTRLHNLSLIANNDLRLIEDIQAERDLIQAWKDELEQKKLKLENMKRQVADNEAELENAAAERVVILGELQGEIALNLKAIQDLENEAQQLDSLIRKLIAEAESQFSGLQGALQYPIEAPTWVSSGYGWRRDPFSGAQAWHGGVDIAPHHGAANYILAAAEGKVIFSGWNGGYGNCLMVDHGGGTVTLYAHMSSLLVKVGDIVTRGQRIARAGTTGYSTGVHLHFEVREFNKPAVRNYPSGNSDYRHNPMNYF